ncbi:tRNA-dihydrouridine synthase [Thiohalobacter thiocyanaticus]|uniref:tRNA-dihydrouridine synthase n=1 Tax=Thiohalobacter thiocyanaticus TaxID=585455 RepID=A0A1Z4VMX9_9GAMM|nr:hypothetical protein [Thiohalobacter thiocyanaticus]BAZ92979.1 tRNA-dihydrouridine synthase [Thiohalobacter thiocyanaticus]
MLRKLLIIFISIVTLPTLGYAVYVWQYNRDTPPPAHAELEAALNASIHWTETNSEHLLSTNNPMLWRMLQQSARLTGDARLQALFDRYTQRYLGRDPDYLWRPLFRDGVWIPVTPASLEGLPYYNRHFIFSLTCDADLWALPDIQAQNQAGFCDGHRFRSACVTHQLMGLRLQQRKQCPQDPDLAATVSRLQARLVGQLTWDPRPVDVYLQRVLMLTESGAGGQVKPAWLRRLLRAQLPDGAWANTPMLLPLPGARDLVWTRNGIGPGRAVGNFHTTAQGIYVLSLLLYGQGDEGRL